ncbi:hypothetical protein MKX07_002186 [Trichoderma sp. CBMAI-0711]|nr:hypothetical protein MKX07_002186 [Trichoderma sp. CBMAI-0711]
MAQGASQAAKMLLPEATDIHKASARQGLQAGVPGLLQGSRAPGPVLQGLPSPAAAGWGAPAPLVGQSGAVSAMLLALIASSAAAKSGSRCLRASHAAAHKSQFQLGSRSPSPSTSNAPRPTSKQLEADILRVLLPTVRSQDRPNNTPKARCSDIPWVSHAATAPEQRRGSLELVHPLMPPSLVAPFFAPPTRITRHGTVPSAVCLLVPALGAVSTCTVSGHASSAAGLARPLPLLCCSGFRAPHLPLKRQRILPTAVRDARRRSVFACLPASRFCRPIFCVLSPSEPLSLVAAPRPAPRHPAIRHRRNPRFCRRPPRRERASQRLKPWIDSPNTVTMAIAMGWHKPDNVAGSSAPAIMVGLFVASGGLLFGYDTGAINGILAMEEFKQRFGTCNNKTENDDICAKDSALIVAILSVGTAVGALLAAPAGDSLGRRRTLLLSVFIFCVGAILQVSAERLNALLVGRCLAGVGVGAVSVLVPLYQSEMAPKWIRGTLVCAYQLSITIGLLSASIINIITSRIPSAASYRIPLGLQLLPAAILTGGLLLLPETPRFLVKQGKKEAAGLSLSRLRRLDITHPALIDELQEIVANHQYELTLGPDTYKEIFVGSPHLGRRTFTGCGIQMLQQLTGINFIMYYSTTFFGGSGVDSPYTKSLIIQVINVVSTFVGVFVIESWGRRKLLIVGAIGMACCQLVMASFAAAAGEGLKQASTTILIVFCSLNIFFFAASWGPVAWVVTSEIYPLKVRAKSMSISTFSNWVLNFGIGYSTPFMVGSGPGTAGFGTKIFFIWGAFCIVAVFFVWAMVYETSKISLEQIDEMYERVDHAWNSRNFEPSWSFQQILDEGWSPSAQPPPDHELQTTSTQSSADTTLGDSNSVIIQMPPTAHHGDGNEITTASDGNKDSVPTMAHVDFSY